MHLQVDTTYSIADYRIGLFCIYLKIGFSQCGMDIGNNEQSDQYLHCIKQFCK